MSVLRNKRRELFCQGIVKGLNQTQAATNAGFSAKSAESSASRLAKDARVKARIVELQVLIVKASETGLTNVEMAAQAEPVPFIRARVADRQYRVTVLGQMVEELRAEKARVTDGGRVSVAVYRETRECLKQVAIELGQWTEKQDHTLRPQPAADDFDYSKVPTEVLEASLAKMKEARAMLIEAAAGTFEEGKG